MTRRRIILAIGIGALLIASAVLLLIYADTFDTGEHAGRCANSRWWAYVGCAMAAHADLAAGLFGGAGALFAAWLAYTAVQDQIKDEATFRERQRAEEMEKLLRQQQEAKETARVCIAPSLIAAKTAFSLILSAQLAEGEDDQKQVDAQLRQRAAYMRRTLEAPTVLESLRDLAPNDRTLYLKIVGTLSLLSEAMDDVEDKYENRYERLSRLNDMFKLVGRYVREFSPELGKFFDQNPLADKAIDLLAALAVIRPPGNQ